MSELKPCPFCGGTYITHEIIPVKHADVKEYYRTICKDCKCGTSMRMSEKDADSDWNRRAEPANEPLTLEQLRQMDGEPVWCVEKQEWMLYRASVDRLSDGEYMFVPDNLTVYAHKPGGEQE